MAISNQDEYIDGREIQNRVAELESAIVEKEKELDGSFFNDAIVADIDCIKDELTPLVELEEELYFKMPDVTLISRDEFENYCFRLVVDCGDISENSSVAAYVDWTRLADHMEQDYTSIDFEGEEYLYRS